MNWLLYLGGGWLWFILVYGIYNSFITINKGNKEVEGIARLISIISILFVWIWLCWRFVK